MKEINNHEASLIKLFNKQSEYDSFADFLVNESYWNHKKSVQMAGDLGAAYGKIAELSSEPVTQPNDLEWCCCVTTGDTLVCTNDMCLNSRGVKVKEEEPKEGKILVLEEDFIDSIEMVYPALDYKIESNNGILCVYSKTAIGFAFIHEIIESGIKYHIK